LNITSTITAELAAYWRRRLCPYFGGYPSHDACRGTYREVFASYPGGKSSLDFGEGLVEAVK